MAAVAAPIVGSVVGGLFGKHSGNRAARAQEQAAQAATAEERRQFDITRADLAPWMTSGRNALTRLNNPAASFTASPDYNFVRSEGQRDIGNSFAARGGAFGGNALRTLTQYNQNLASGQFGNWWNRQAGLAGVGQQTATNLGQLGQQTAGSIGNALIGAGDARASGIIGGTNALIGGLGDALSAWQYSRRPKGTPPINGMYG